MKLQARAWAERVAERFDQASCREQVVQEVAKEAVTAFQQVDAALKTSEEFQCPGVLSILRSNQAYLLVPEIRAPWGNPVENKRFGHFAAIQVCQLARFECQMLARDAGVLMLTPGMLALFYIIAPM